MVPHETENTFILVRLGTPPRRGVEKPEGPSALQPTTEYDIYSCQ